MLDFWKALGEHAFLQHALLGAFLASIACGMIGPFVVVRRMGYVAGGVSHAVFGGMGLAYFLGQTPILGALVAALIAGLIIGFVTLHGKRNEDIVISAIWAFGMALGVIFISKTPGYASDLMTYLFGNILLISEQGLILMTILSVALMVFVFLFYKQLLAISFDEEFCRLRKVHVNFLHIALVCAIALTTIVLVRVVGLILVIALLTIPAAISRFFVKSMQGLIALAVIFGFVVSFIGLGLSYKFNFPGGATIILILTALYFLLSMIRTKVV